MTNGNTHKDMPIRYVLLYKKDPSGTVYDRMCLDEIGSEEFDAFTCHGTETGSNYITGGLMASSSMLYPSAKLERDSLRLTLPQNRSYFSSHSSEVSYQCSVLSKPLETKSFIEQAKIKQMARNKI